MLAAVMLLCAGCGNKKREQEVIVPVGTINETPSEPSHETAAETSGDIQTRSENAPETGGALTPVLDKVVVMLPDISGEDVQSGYIDENGNRVATDSWVVTGYIPTAALDEITLEVSAYSVPYAAFYDRYKVFLSSATAKQQGDQTISVAVPSEASYVRFNFYNGVPTQSYSYVVNMMKKNAVDMLNAADKLYGKKYAATGDSITIGTWSVPEQTYVYQIANAHNMTVNNAGIWGAVFPVGKTEGDKPRGSIYSTIEQMDADADIVTISGGINDADYWNDETYWGEISGGYDAELDVSTFCGAFEATLKSALAKWKGKPILFVFEHRMTQLYQSAYGQHFENVQFPLMVEMLEKWGIPYVDLFHEMPSIKLTPDYIALYSYDDQGVHPNVQGYRKFYVPRVESRLLELAT